MPRQTGKQLRNKGLQTAKLSPTRQSGQVIRHKKGNIPVSACSHITGDGAALRRHIKPVAELNQAVWPSKMQGKELLVRTATGEYPDDSCASMVEQVRRSRVARAEGKLVIQPIGLQSFSYSWDACFPFRILDWWLGLGLLGRRRW